MNDQPISNLNWQQAALEKILLENLREQRRKRRWTLFFRFIYLIIFLFILLAIFSSKKSVTSNPYKPHTAIIKIDGMIMPGADASADHVVSSLTKAFSNSNTQAIILRINSPGGSPVQASDIYHNIMRFRKQYPNIKIYAVCSDLCTSAAYYIASATDDIYANPSSLVGSIGVLLNGFGFVGAMEKLGIERRLLIAGNEKGFLDPFSPQKPQDVQIAQQLLNIIHLQFIRDVKRGRGLRLKDSPELFSGLAWTGTQAKNMGLIDGYGSAGSVARNVIKNTNLVDYTKKTSFIDQISKGVGASFSHALIAELGLNGDTLR